ncbi:MAG: chemotaxis protein CheW [Gemmatimonadota bacterium]
MSVIEFTVAGECFALPLEAVEAVSELAVAAGRGEAQRYRGEDLKVVSARDLLGLSGEHDVEARNAIVLRTTGDRLLLAVDEITGVLTLDDSSIAPAPSYYAGRCAEMVRGVAMLDGRLLVVLEPSSMAPVGLETEAGDE